MTKARHFVPTVTLLLSVIGGRDALAQRRPHPDFSGTWILDVARSDSSSFTPKSATYVVVQGADSIILDRETSGTGKQHAIYALDGTPRVNSLRLIGTSTDATSKTEWVGDTLVVHTISHPEDADLVQTDRWSLGPENGVLRIKRDAVYGGQSIGSPTLVFAKKP